ncbi:MAG: HEAT repeat domain-containing protein [Planctomycetota bacterium]|nr:HEAT repeat domain-containing protein [Planctomycetota bacterium]
MKILRGCVLLALMLLAESCFYLGECQGQEAVEESVRSAVERLGHPDWRVRDEANREILSIGEPAIPALRHATSSQDPEVRWRSRRLLERILWNFSDEIRKQAGPMLHRFSRLAPKQRVERIHHLALRMREDALPIYLRVLIHDPDSIVREAVIREVVQLGSEAVDVEVLRVLEKSSQVDSVRLMARLLESRRRVKESLEAYERILGKTSLDSEDLFRCARMYENLERWDQAVDLYAQAGQSQAWLTEAGLGQIRCLGLLGKKAEAIRVGNRILEASGVTRQLVQRLSLVYQDLRFEEGQVELLKRAVQIFQEDARFCVRLGDCLAGQGRWEEATDILALGSHREKSSRLQVVMVQRWARAAWLTSWDEQRMLQGVERTVDPALARGLLFLQRGEFQKAKPLLLESLDRWKGAARTALFRPLLAGIEARNDRVTEEDCRQILRQAPGSGFQIHRLLERLESSWVMDLLLEEVARPEAARVCSAIQALGVWGERFLKGGRGKERTRRRRSLGDVFVRLAAKEQDISTRMASLKALGTLGDLRAVPWLLRRFEISDEPEMIRLEIWKALQKLETPSAVESYPVTLLSSPVRQLRELGVKTCGERKLIASVSVLVERFEREGEDLQVEIIRSLAQIDTDPAVLFLKKARRSTSEEIRFQVVSNWVSQLSRKRAVPLLMESLEDPGVLVRIEAVAQLHQLGDRRGLPVLRQILASGEPHERWSAVGALARMREAETVPDLKKVLKDPDADLRRVAVETLRSIGTEKSLESIEWALSDTSLRVRMEAVRCLVLRGRFARSPKIHQVLEEIAEEYSNESEPHRWLAIRFLYEGKVSQAIRESRIAYWCDPESFEARELMALTHFAKGSHSLGSRLVKDVVRLYEARIRLENGLLEKAGLEASLAYFQARTGVGLESTLEPVRRALKSYPEEAYFYEVLARIYWVAGDLEKALEVLEEGKRRVPRDPGRWIRLRLEMRQPYRKE